MEGCAVTVVFSFCVFWLSTAFFFLPCGPVGLSFLSFVTGVGILLGGLFVTMGRPWNVKCYFEMHLMGEIVTYFCSRHTLILRLALLAAATTEHQY